MRDVVTQDLPFLVYLYRTTRWNELAPTGWSDEAKNSFLHQQFQLQHHHYTTYYQGADFQVIARYATPIGRLYLYRGAREYRIVDIALLPEWCSLGIGTALLHAIFAEAKMVSRPVTIHVEQFNPAQRLYERLGFRVIGNNGPYRLMEWRPGPPQVYTA